MGLVATRGKLLLGILIGLLLLVAFLRLQVRQKGRIARLQNEIRASQTLAEFRADTIQLYRNQLQTAKLYALEQSQLHQTNTAVLLAQIRALPVSAVQKRNLELLAKRGLY